MIRGGLFRATLLTLTACSDRPEAPPLNDETVFHSDAVGLRFLAPAGWSIASRAVLPSGALPRPIMLVVYQSIGGDKPAALEVMVVDVPADIDLGRFLAEHPLGNESWKPLPPEPPILVNGVSAPRLSLVRMQGKEELHREVTAFRRGDRVYFFLATFAASDAASRDTARTAVASVTWK
jgi:predicted Zn-dependent protease